MNEKQAKALRRALLPHPRTEVGATRGSVMRTLVEHVEDGTIVREYPWPLQELYGPLRFSGPVRIINKPGTPRAVYRNLKKELRSASR